MANALTLMRIFLIVPFAAAMFAPGDPAGWTALGLFVLAGLTDFLDGAVARSRNETSKLGAALDPVADKMLAAAALFLLVMQGTLYGLHILAGLVIILREIWVAGLREALSGRDILRVSPLAKAKTTLQFVGIALLLVPLGGTITGIGLIILWLAALLTLYTGFQYTRRAIAALKHADTA